MNRDALEVAITDAHHAGWNAACNSNEYGSPHTEEAACIRYLGDVDLSVILAALTTPEPGAVARREEGDRVKVRRIYVRWADDGVHIRKWSHEPFGHGEPVDAVEDLK